MSYISISMRTKSISVCLSPSISISVPGQYRQHLFIYLFYPQDQRRSDIVSTNGKHRSNTKNSSSEGGSQIKTGLRLESTKEGTIPLLKCEELSNTPLIREGVPTDHMSWL